MRSARSAQVADAGGDAAVASASKHAVARARIGRRLRGIADCTAASLPPDPGGCYESSRGIAMRPVAVVGPVTVSQGLSLRTVLRPMPLTRASSTTFAKLCFAR